MGLVAEQPQVRAAERAFATSRLVAEVVERHRPVGCRGQKPPTLSTSGRHQLGRRDHLLHVQVEQTARSSPDHLGGEGVSAPRRQDHYCGTRRVRFGDWHETAVWDRLALPENGWRPYRRRRAAIKRATAPARTRK